MTHDETLLGVSEKVKNFAVICEFRAYAAASVADLAVFDLRHLRHYQSA
jgi:hypothetical protein